MTSIAEAVVPDEGPEGLLALAGGCRPSADETRVVEGKVSVGGEVTRAPRHRCGDRERIAEVLDERLPNPSYLVSSRHGQKRAYLGVELRQCSSAVAEPSTVEPAGERGQDGDERKEEEPGPVGDRSRQELEPADAEGGGGEYAGDGTGHEDLGERRGVLHAAGEVDRVQAAAGEGAAEEVAHEEVGDERVPAAMALMFVVSDSGDILSPETTAPAVTARETSIAAATPMRATPMVPAEPHEVPVKVETTAVVAKAGT